MPRGELIFPMEVVLGLLDTYATSQVDPDGPTGPLVGGYDDEFREPNKFRTPTQGSKPGKMVRVETKHRFLAQVEDDAEQAMEMLASGNSPQNSIGLVFHYKDLEAVGAVQTKRGKPIIKAPGARLISIHQARTHKLIESYEGSPGFWATQARSMGFGLGPGLESERNLLLVVFEERDVSLNQG